MPDSRSTESATAEPDQNAFRDGFVSVGNLRLAYREWRGPAESEPPLLLIHGLASSRRIWDLVAPLLARTRRVVALDQRGHGESDKPKQGYTTSQFVADDRALAGALGLARPVIVGHSWGAAIALAYAAGYPDEVSGLVLVDGGVTDMQSRPEASWERIERELMPPDYADTPRVAFLERMRGRSDLPWRPEFEDILLGIVQLHADDTVGPRLAREQHRRILRALWEFRSAAYFARLRCPVAAVLALSSSDDERTRAFVAAKQRGAASFLELVDSPWKQVIWLPDTAHDIPLHRPETLAEHIDAVIAVARDGR